MLLSGEILSQSTESFFSPKDAETEEAEDAGPEDEVDPSAAQGPAEEVGGISML